MEQSHSAGDALSPGIEPASPTGTSIRFLLEAITVVPEVTTGNASFCRKRGSDTTRKSARLLLTLFFSLMREGAGPGGRGVSSECRATRRARVSGGRGQGLTVGPGPRALGPRPPRSRRPRPDRPAGPGGPGPREGGQGLTAGPGPQAPCPPGPGRPPPPPPPGPREGEHQGVTAGPGPRAPCPPGPDLPPPPPPPDSRRAPRTARPRSACQ